MLAKRSLARAMTGQAGNPPVLVRDSLQAAFLPARHTPHFPPLLHAKPPALTSGGHMAGSHDRHGLGAHPVVNVAAKITVEGEAARRGWAAREGNVSCG